MLLKPDTGIDISHWQLGIKIANLTPRPRFAIIKASEGTNYTDDTTLDFSAQIRALGIPLGFYHFWKNVNPITQADLYLRQVNLAGGMERIPPVLDLEVDLTGQTANVKHWLDRIEIITGKRPILYGNKGIFSKLGNPIWFKDYDIWTASYPLYPDNWDWVPPLYSITNGRREIMWQYAATYSYPAAYPLTKIDTNIAIPAFLKEIGEVTPPIGEPPMTIYDIKSSMNIRSATSVTSTDIGDLLINDRIEVTIVQVSATDKWGKLSKITRAGANVALPAAVCYVSLNTTGTVEFIPPVTILPILPVSITLGDDVTYAKQTVTVNLQPLK
jgi:hypothetical protein